MPLHEHNHHHHQPPNNFNRAFALGIVLNVAYVLAEACCGFWFNSLALLADAGHNLSDVLGLLLAWGATYLSRRPPSERYTYGLRSSTILAALLNGLLLMVAIGGITWEAIQRFWTPPAIPGLPIIVVAGFGVVINAVTAALFVRGRKSDLNVRGAFLHMAADAAVSLGVVVAGAAIITTGWLRIDPSVSLLVAIVIFFSTWSLLRESFDLLLQAVPRGIDPKEVTEFLRTLPGVDAVHDLHIWAMSTTETALTAHLVKPEAANEDRLLSQAADQLHSRFGIEHTTLQIERGTDGHQCSQSLPDSL